MQSWSLNLALQGGGAHGAFTWGVLDRLLAAEHISFGMISGTSAGAVNAVALLSGLARNGRTGAREALATLWQAIARRSALTLPWLGAVMDFAPPPSPYTLDPLDLNPLRRLLQEQIDFDAIRQDASLPDVLIAATEVRSGRARLFRRAELSLDVVLASACLPMLMRAVEIDGVGYWDGGFSANPDLVTLAREAPSADTLLILLNPRVRSDMPLSGRAIAGHVSALAFQQPLLRDIREIVAVRRAMQVAMRRRWPWQAATVADRLATHRFHLIDGGPHTASLAPHSRIAASAEVLDHLHAAGHAEAERWLMAPDAHRGLRPGIDLAAEFL